MGMAFIYWMGKIYYGIDLPNYNCFTGVSVYTIVFPWSTDIAGFRRSRLFKPGFCYFPVINKIKGAG